MIGTCEKQVIGPYKKKHIDEERRRARAAYAQYFGNPAFLLYCCYVWASMSCELSRRDHALMRSYIFEWDLEWTNKAKGFTHTRKSVVVNGIPLKTFPSQKACQV